MKTKISILTTIVVLITIAVFAFPAEQYRSQFRPSGNPCLQEGYIYRMGGGHTDITNNPAYTYTINPGDHMVLWMDPNCCGQGGEYGQQVGVQWAQFTDPQGHWWNIANSTMETYVPPTVAAEQYKCDNSGISQDKAIQPCP